LFFNKIYIFFIMSLYLFSGVENIKENQILILDKGVYYLKDIELKDNIVIRGKSRFNTVLILDRGAKKALFYAKDKSNIEISNLTILNNSSQRVPLLLFEGDKKGVSNILIKDCILKSHNSSSDVLLFRDYLSNIRIENNIIEAKINPKIRRDYRQIASIKFHIGANIYNRDNSNIYIVGNSLKYGNSGFRISGRGVPPYPLWFENNTLQGQIGCGACFYHGVNQKIVNNYFSNIVSVSMKNNDGGVVWLDSYRNGDILFSGNTIANNYGNGLFIEELQNAIISNNFIYGNRKRVDDTFNTKNGAKSYHSSGGNGILITGGVRRLQIVNNQISNNEANGILLNRNLGVSKNYNILMSNIVGNSIINNGGFSIKVEDNSRNITIKDNILISKDRAFTNIKSGDNLEGTDKYKLIKKAY